MRSFHSFLLEYDRSKTVASLGSKFQARMSGDKDLRKFKLSTPESIVAHLEKGDPTPNKQYVQWLVKTYTNGSELEDLISRGHDSLVKFEELKKKKLLPAGQTDIGRLSSIDELESLVDSIDIPEEQLKDKGKSEEIWDDDEVRIIVPHDETAACYYGQSTKWCTAAKNNNMFSHYNKDGQLVIFLPKHPKHPGEKYQVHFRHGQWMNEQDQAIAPKFLKTRFPTIDFKALKAQTDSTFDKEFIKRFASQTDGVERMFTHAHDVLHHRWPIAEPYIMKDPEWALNYASKVIKDRWPEAEPYIMKDPAWATWYSIEVIEDRWEEAEPYIMKDPAWAYFYVTNNVRGRWPEAEPYIMKAPEYAYKYAKNIIKGRWPEAEPYIMKVPEFAHHYASKIIKGRWPEAEPYIRQSSHWKSIYDTHVDLDWKKS